MRFALGIEYDGHDYYGWQHQEGLQTIQGSVEHALSTIANAPITVFCAGRTDAGVHATGQVIHFETDIPRSERAWSVGTNTHLPPGIAVRWIKEVPDDFHARFSAQSRRYRYIIYNHSLRPALHAKRVTWNYHPLDEKRMHNAAQSLIGEHDFTSFRSSQCESKTPMRCVEFITVSRQGLYVTIDIQANAFLHHMVRNIAGSLMRVGAGLEPEAWVKQVLKARDRRVAAETAAPTGLYLTHVTYPAFYQLPEETSSCFID